MFDRTFAFLVLSMVLIPCLFVSILIKTNSKGPVIHWSKRVGQNNKYFLMPKFRTMKINTPQLATHLLDNPNNYVTTIGRYLRKYSIDELPQFWSVLLGNMSVVGPRPALYNQENLIRLRNKNDISSLKPGVTGWAQVNGRDLNTIDQKVEFEIYYLQNKSFFFDIYIVGKTLKKIFFISETLH
jgi:O-antigen biosynthesis protein WbqP